MKQVRSGFVLRDYIKKLPITVLSKEEQSKKLAELFSRSYMKDQDFQAYLENLPVSIMDQLVKSGRNIPSEWNLNKMDTLLQNMQKGNDIPGVTSSMVYCGEIGTSSTFHVEDADLMSINYLYPGSDVKVS